MVHRPAGPLQRLGHAALPVARELQHDGFDLIPQGHLGLSGRGGLRGIKPTATDVEDGAELADRHQRAQLLNEGVLDAERDCARCKAFFSTLFSPVSWPTMRSNWAILSSAAGAVLAAGVLQAPRPCWAY